MVRHGTGSDHYTSWGDLGRTSDYDTLEPGAGTQETLENDLYASGGNYSPSNS